MGPGPVSRAAPHLPDHGYRDGNPPRGDMGIAPRQGHRKFFSLFLESPHKGRQESPGDRFGESQIYKGIPGNPAHGGNVAQVDGQALPPQSGRGDRFGEEMNPFHHGVGGDQPVQPPRPKHRAIIPDPLDQSGGRTVEDPSEGFNDVSFLHPLNP